MKSKAQHTPTPWNLNDHQGYPVNSKEYIRDSNGLCIATVHEMADGIRNAELRAESAGNAAFIVRAVNSHEDMLEVLKIVALFDPSNPNILIQMCAVRDEAKRAIAKAEGKQ